jgi:acyl-coenzyme A synthetase/AMP-(fatty) acid ligase
MTFAPTLAAELRRTAARHPQLAAFHFHGRDYSYAEWDAYADRFARALLAQGLRKGDRLVLLLPAIPHYLFCYLGAARIGVIGRHQHATAGTRSRNSRQRRSPPGADGRRCGRRAVRSADRTRGHRRRASATSCLR